MSVVPHPRVSVDRIRMGNKQGTRTAPKVIVLHSTESKDRPGVSDVEGVLKFLERTEDGLGVHAVVDGEGNVGRGAGDFDIVYHVRGANAFGLGIEMVGFARWKTTDWLYTKLPTKKGRAARARRVVLRRQLLVVAQLIAHWSTVHDIPIVLSTSHGVATHAMFPEGGHWDPGPGFPLGYVLRQARRIVREHQRQERARA